MGFLDRMVHRRGHDDRHGWPFSLQHGLVGFYLPGRSVFPQSKLSHPTGNLLTEKGVFTLLTIAIGEELESHFFKVLSCVSPPSHILKQVCRHLTSEMQVLAGMCVAAWLPIAAMTLYRSFTGKMFYAPCLGTNLYGKVQKQHLEHLKGDKV
jgi:hypothetical protein